MTVPEKKKKDPFLTGNQGHFTNFYPYFAVNQGKINVKIPPYYYPFKDIFFILYPISREIKDKILRKKRTFPLNNASLYTHYQVYKIIPHSLTMHMHSHFHKLHHILLWVWCNL